MPLGHERSRNEAQDYARRHQLNPEEDDYADQYEGQRNSQKGQPGCGHVSQEHWINHGAETAVPPQAEDCQGREVQVDVYLRACWSRCFGLFGRILDSNLERAMLILLCAGAADEC
jgi:hypothetical protein